MAIITVRPPTEAEKKFFSQVDTSKLPQPSVSITPSGSKKLSSGYIPGGATTTGGGSRSRIPAKPVTYSSTILQQSFTSIEERDRAEREFFEQQKQQVTSVVAPTQKRLDIVTPVKKEDVYREPILTRIKKSSVGQRISGIGTGLSTVGKQIYEIGRGTISVIKEAEVTPTTAWYGLEDLSREELGSVVYEKEEVDIGTGKGVILDVPKPKYTEERLASTRKGAELLVERDESLLKQDLLTLSDNLIRQEQEKLNNIVSNEISKFETKWASKVSGNQFIGTKKEYEQYQRESKELENVIEIEQRKSNQRYNNIFDLESTKLISEFEKKSGKRISKGEITQTIGRAPIYAGIGALTAGVAPAIVGGSAIATGTIKTIGLVGLGATAVTGYVQGLEGDYTSVAKLGITTGAALAGGLAYSGIKAGQRGYTKYQIKQLQKLPEIGGQAILPGKTGIYTGQRITTVRTVTGVKPISLQRQLQFTVGQTQPAITQGKLSSVNIGTGRDTFQIRGLLGGQKIITSDFKFMYTPKTTTGLDFPSLRILNPVDVKSWTQYGQETSWQFGRGAGFNLGKTTQGRLVAGARYSDITFKPTTTVKDGIIDIKVKPIRGTVKGLSSLTEIRTPVIKQSSIKFVSPADITKTPFSVTFKPSVTQTTKTKIIPPKLVKGTTLQQISQGLTASIKPQISTESIYAFKPVVSLKDLTFTQILTQQQLQKSLTKQRYGLGLVNLQQSFLTQDLKFQQSFKQLQQNFKRGKSITSFTIPSIAPTQAPIYRGLKTPFIDLPTFKFPKKTDSLKFGVKGKVFKQKGLTKMYQASLGAIALDYGITRDKFKNYKGKPFTGTELRPFVLKNNK